MGELAQQLLHGKKLLHIEAVDYAERLFAGGKLDWLNASDIAAVFGRIQKLLPSDLVIVPADRVLGAWCAANPKLRESLARKPEGAQPLRVLLADAALRVHVLAVVRMVSAAVSDAVVILEVPDPATIACYAARSAGVPAPAVDEDLADDAAVYLADFLRVFAQSPVQALLITEADGHHVSRAFYAPLRKVAAHYGWDAGVRTGAPGPDASAAGVPAFEGDYWPAVLTMAIAPDSEPESVLATVQKAREACLSH